MKKFTIGACATTPGALEKVVKADGVLSLLSRHQSGDWGDMSDEDKAANEAAILNGERIVSTYILMTGVKVYVITEADRSSTAILLPEEY